MFKPTIGIEMHCEMKSHSKVFSSAENTYTKHANNHVSPIDLGLPGILPNLNKECVRKSLMMASILHCTIPEILVFDRKNYYYPDLPKGYQITQSHSPIGINGYIDIPLENKILHVLIHDIHLEEDSARLEHLSHESLINYNRSGIPLLELVTGPSFHSKEEVLVFLDMIRKIYQYTDISDADIKKGQIRCDVNISLSEDDNLGTKVEIKNVNGFSNIEKVIDIEVKRQLDLINEGKKDQIKQETRRFDEATNTTIRMRSKVDAIDYKYFVEPNIPIITIDPDWIEEIKKSIPVLPMELITKYQSLGLINEDIGTIIKDKDLAHYYNECLENQVDPLKACNWLTGNIISYLNKEEMSISDLLVTPYELSLLLKSIEENKISSKQAKDIFNDSLSKNIPIHVLLKEVKSQITDPKTLANLISKIVSEHPTEVEAYHHGRTNLFNFFVGLVMKETKGSADPVLTKQLITQELTK